MKAIGSYIFAGGFTIGVKKHFDIGAYNEQKLRFGRPRTIIAIAVRPRPPTWTGSPRPCA